MLKTLRNTLGPTFLILLTPPVAILMWYTMVYLDGSIGTLFLLFAKFGFFQILANIWGPVFWGSVASWKMIAVFGITELILMKALPGKIELGPITPKGNVPLYKANGPLAFITTIFLFFVSSYGLRLFSPTIIYDHFGELIGALNIFSLIFCLFLYFKGKYRPSTTDSGTSGNFIFDYYWGSELYPRVWGWDIKMFTNCRFGMMGWAVILLSFLAKQHATGGVTNALLVSSLLQLLYIGKFFLWEMGYMRSLDIMHDRAGYYICWGCLVWVPSVYTSPALYLVNQKETLGIFGSLLIFVLGAFAILTNYFADRQRQKVRAHKGDCKVWGKKPVMTVASYVTLSGEKKKSLLLASGFWGISRHFHYVPEILGAFFWTLPALFMHFLPYFYVLFLTILLLDRAFRDEKRCKEKYGKDWDKHCEKVPYKIIPYIL